MQNSHSNLTDNLIKQNKAKMPVKNRQWLITRSGILYQLYTSYFSIIFDGTV